MKKVILSERQIKKLMDNVLNEQVPAMRAIEYPIDDGRYHMKCEFYFEYQHHDFITYKNGEIYDMSLGYGDVSFQLEIDHQPYGIKSITIRDIRGPKEVKCEIKYFPPGVTFDDDDSWNQRKTETIMIPLNWRNLELDDSGHYEMDYYGIYKQIEVRVEPDGKGGLEGGRMTVVYKDLKD